MCVCVCVCVCVGAHVRVRVRVNQFAADAIYFFIISTGSCFPSLCA